MVKLLTLNVRGIQGHAKQNALNIYVKRQQADIILLQETNLPDTTDLPIMHPYTFLQNPAFNRGSGTAIGISKKLQDQAYVHSSNNIEPGYLQTCHVTLHNTDFQIINIYMPTSTEQAVTVATALSNHLASIPLNRKIIAGGDWNVTLMPQDRKNHLEKRNALAQQIGKATTTHSLVDVWRRSHPNSKQYTYRGNQSTQPQSRLDRIYITEQWAHQTHSAQICPYFADHAGLTVVITPPPPHKQSPRIWRFQNRLLNDQEFIDIMKNIINHYTTTVMQDGSIQQHWDAMKQEIKITVQRYEEHLKRQKNQKYQELEQQIRHLTNKQELTEAEERVLNMTGTTLQKKFRQEANLRILRTYNQQRHSKITQRLLFPSTSPPPSRPQLQTLKIQNTLTTDPHQIRTEVQNFYKHFYSSKGNKPNINENFYHGLPKLSEDEREKNEDPIEMSELANALSNTQNGKSPGLDGITYEFYKYFWTELSPLLLRVIKTSLEEGHLPTSMYKGIIILVPKRGDLTNIRNWRPITLLNTDYKLLTRCVAKRITNVLPKLITSNQSYGVPHKSIQSNLHLIRDTINYANQQDLPLAIISLDQAAAYDCVEHTYLFHTLLHFGFGNKFINNVRTIYRHSQGLVKLNGILSAPFPFARGVRQGDPLSGPLFTLTLEPFLIQCNNSMQQYGLPVPSNNHTTLVTTAYADDVTVFITHNKGFEQLLHNFMIYGALSGAALNTQKTTGLFVGRWKSRTDQPSGFKWNNQGEKYLGIYLGNTQTWQQQNWSELESRIRKTLSQWTKRAHTTSLQERKYIINHLVCAKLVHTIKILTPTPLFLRTMEKLMINFIWQGQHLKHPNFVYSKLRSGGIGVQHLPSRIQTFRFDFLQNFITRQKKEHDWHFQAYNIQAYEPHLKAVDVLKLNLTSSRYLTLPPFYASAFQAWHTLAPRQNPHIQSYNNLRSTPIFKSTLLNPHISGNSLAFEEAWGKLHIYYIGDLLDDTNNWKDIEQIHTEQCTRPTIRRMSNNIHAAKIFFRHHYPNLPPHSTPNSALPSFVIQQTNHVTLSLPITRRILYQNFLQSNLNPHVPVTGESPWNLGKPNWEAVYQSPIQSKDGDITWKLLHNRIATPQMLYLWKKRGKPDCPWCPGTSGTTQHMFIECPSAKQLWDYLNPILQALLGPHTLNKKLILYGYPTVQTIPQQLASYLLVLANVTIYKTYLAADNVVCQQDPNYTKIFRLRLTYRLQLELHHNIWNNNIIYFQNFWLHNNILGKLTNGQLLTNY
jgi:exonuclease III